MLLYLPYNGVILRAFQENPIDVAFTVTTIPARTPIPGRSLGTSGLEYRESSLESLSEFVSVGGKPFVQLDCVLCVVSNGFFGCIAYAVREDRVTPCKVRIVFVHSGDGGRWYVHGENDTSGGAEYGGG